MDEKEFIQLKKEKLKRIIYFVLKHKEKFILSALVLFSIIYKLYYFFITMDQPVWWDEAEYMATAKHWGLDVPYNINPQRPPLFPLLGSIMYKLSFSDPWIKFLLVIIPTLLCIPMVYLLGKEMYNKNTGLVAAFIMSVFWSLHFWAMRFQPDALVLLFQMLSVYFFWKSFVNKKTPEKKKTKFAILSGLSAAIAFLVKIQTMLLFIIFGLFILFTKRIKLLKEKRTWYAAIALIIPLIPYLIWNYFFHGRILAFTTGYSAGVETKQPIAWNMAKFIPAFTENIFFVIFSIGAVVAIIALILNITFFRKRKFKNANADFFSIIAMLIVPAFFIFYIRGGGEERWLMLMVPFMYFFTAKGCGLIYKCISWLKRFKSVGEYSKVCGAVIILAIFFYGAYEHLQHGEEIISAKEKTYQYVKDAALWMKENTKKGDKIMSVSYTQTVFYSERNVTTYSQMSPEELGEFLKKSKPKFITASIYEKHPEWTDKFLQVNEKAIVPVKIYYQNQEKKEPALVIYAVHPNIN